MASERGRAMGDSRCARVAWQMGGLSCHHSLKGGNIREEESGG